MCVFETGGFGSYLFGMSDVVAKQSAEANTPLNIKNPHLGWMIGFLFIVSFLGLFSVVPLRKVRTLPNSSVTLSLQVTFCNNLMKFVFFSPLDYDSGLQIDIS